MTTGAPYLAQLLLRRQSLQPTCIVKSRVRANSRPSPLAWALRRCCCPSSFPARLVLVLPQTARAQLHASSPMPRRAARFVGPGEHSSADIATSLRSQTDEGRITHVKRFCNALWPRLNTCAVFASVHGAHRLLTAWCSERAHSTAFGASVPSQLQYCRASASRTELHFTCLRRRGRHAAWSEGPGTATACHVISNVRLRHTSASRVSVIGAPHGHNCLG
jgi:hypothetical protein